MKPAFRVAMIMQRYLPHVGGAERQVASLSPLLRDRGVDVHVVTRMHIPLPAREDCNGVAVYRIRTPGPKPVASLCFTLQAQFVLRRIHAHILHAHELLSPVTAAVLAKRRLHVPVVAKVLRGGVLGDIEKLRLRPDGRLRIRMLRRQVDAFAAISREIAAELRGMGIADRRICTIPNGVDTVRFQPADEERKAALRSRMNLGGDPLVVYAGRLVPEKAVDMLVRVWTRVSKRHPAARLLILGDGPERGRLAAEASDRVRFEGAVEDVAPYLRAADIFVLPSDTEGLSNSFLEAMACGLAVIATAVGGATDLVGTSGNGLLVPPRDEEALVRAIDDFCGSAQRRRAAGVAARSTIESGYSLTAVADRLVSLYRELSGVNASDPEPASNRCLRTTEP